MRGRPLLAIFVGGASLAAAACSLFLDDLSEREGPSSSSFADAEVDRSVASPDPGDGGFVLEEIEAGPPPEDIPKDTLDCTLANLVLCDGFEQDDLLDGGKWDRLRIDGSVIGSVTNASAASGQRSFLLQATSPAAADEIAFLSADRLVANTLRQVTVEADVLVDPSVASFAANQSLTILSIQPAEEAGFASDQTPRAKIVVAQGGSVSARVRTYGNDKEKVIAFTGFPLGVWKRIYLYVRFSPRAGELLAKLDKVTMGNHKGIETLDKTRDFNSVALGLVRSAGTPSAFVRFDNVHVRVGPQ